MKSDTGLSTRCVHAGEIQDAQGSPHTPLYTTTTFKFKSTADLLDVAEGRKTSNLYARYGSNPHYPCFGGQTCYLGKNGSG